MHPQTVDQAMELLCMIQQPAFCIRNNGTMVCNEAGKCLCPSCSAELSTWLGNAKIAYDLWDRSGQLQLTVSVLDGLYSVILQQLQDGTLFLMHEHCNTSLADSAMAVTSQVLRQPLSELTVLLNQIQRNTDFYAAPFYRQIYRMSRIVFNLTQTGRLNSNDPTLNITKLDTQIYPGKLLTEVEELCKCMGRNFSCSAPAAPLTFYADTTLLNCALLNLISNAMKFSPAETPIRLRIDVVNTHLVFQVENTCAGNGSELLRSAFSRLSQRGVIPDTKWGIGLGLPLVSTIARLHNGMLAVETTGGRAIVSLSISMRDRKDDVLHAPAMIDYTGGMRQTLLELSDALPVKAFE